MRQHVSVRNANDVRLLNPARDLGQLADLIENAFGEELTHGGERVLRELRVLSWLGPLNILFTGVSSETDGVFTGFVWEHNGRVVGNVTINRPTGHPRRWQISNVAVQDAYRGQGIGRKLVEAAIDLVSRRGGYTAYLFVRDTNSLAQRLYQSLGFAEVDQITDLTLPLQPTSPEVSAVGVLRPLRPGEGETLYELVLRAAGPGHRWLSAIRRRHYVRSADERFFRWIGSLVTAERETLWGVSDGNRLDAGVSLRVTRLWNRKPHRIRLWIRPERRGQVEDALVHEVITLLSRAAPRPTSVSLPACEEQAIDALLRQSFRKIRTLILMKLDL